ncbi:DNA polymerase III subunit delta [Anaerobacillus sp. MEB173]|uniref:DNA polymerase III subunit delta n=1 Tax=Anaerobacillus sp. MEB173 TaxID=3383345 RepID=UPI003F8E1F99
MSYIDLQKKIKRKQISPVYLFFGTEQFLIEETLQTLLNATLQESEMEFNLSVYEMKETPVDVAIEDAETLPFFGEKKVVLVKDAYFLTGGKEQAKIEHNIKRLETYVENPVQETIFVLIAPYEKLDERKKIVKLLKQHSEQLNANSLDEKAVKEWIHTYSQEYQIDIPEIAKDRLIQLVGLNLMMITNELEKLTIHVGIGGVIDESIVESLVARTVEQDIFALVDHIVHRRLEKGLRIFYDLLKQKEEPIKILALLARQFRIIYQVKELVRRGYSQKQIAGQIKLHPYVVKLATDQGRLFQDKELLGFLDQLAEADFKMKTGQMEKQLVLELFITGLFKVKN